MGSSILKLSTKLMEQLDCIAVKFNVMGDDLYFVTKNRYGKTGITMNEINESEYENGVYIVEFSEFDSKGKEAFIKALIEAIS